MGLAAYGDPARYAAAFEQIAYTTPDGGFETADHILRFKEITYYPPSAYCEGLENLFGIKKRERGQPLNAVHHDIAAALQQKTDELVYHMAVHLHALTGSSNLCLAGGVALNCVTNHHVLENGPYQNLYVQPAAHDGGTSLGAAFYVWNHILGEPVRGSMSHAYLGPAFSDEEIEEQLQRQHLKYDRVAELEREVARLISQQNVVGFFQGSMEYGPRALGNRSILADPRHADMREILNHKVKHREYFRPFAPSVLHEEAANWFRIGKEAPAADFMLIAYPAREEVAASIPAVIHADGTCRVQTVKQEANPRFHRVISEFNKLTGIPVVLNTSFNDQEPIICTPADAIGTFLKTEIDYLAIGSFLVRKETGRGRNGDAA
jgi:carbamoyltransferase